MPRTGSPGAKPRRAWIVPRSACAPCRAWRRAPCRWKRCSREREAGRWRHRRRAQAAPLQARRIRAMRWLCASLCAALIPVAAAADAVSAIALYEGRDRAERLVDGARKEATLNLYTSLTVADMAALSSVFEAKYGIKIRMWRAASEKVLQRVLAEAKAGRHDVDIVETNAPPLESLHREGVLQAVRSPNHAELIPAEQLKRKGAPLDWFVIAPAIARANGVALARRAPHPHAALLCYDFMISDEGQRILQERGFVPARRSLQGSLGAELLRIVDPALMLDHAEKWGRLYESIFLSQRR